MFKLDTNSEQLVVSARLLSLHKILGNLVPKIEVKIVLRGRKAVLP